MIDLIIVCLALGCFSLVAAGQCGGVVVDGPSGYDKEKLMLLREHVLCKNPICLDGI